MDEHLPQNAAKLLKRPSAFLPLAMSAAAISVLLSFLAVYGVVHQEDEGAAARLFQLLIGLQIPVVAFFALTWLPRRPRAALAILALQLGAAAVALAPVLYFDW